MITDQCKIDVIIAMHMQCVVTTRNALAILCHLLHHPRSVVHVSAAQQLHEISVLLLLIISDKTWSADDHRIVYQENLDAFSNLADTKLREIYSYTHTFCYTELIQNFINVFLLTIQFQQFIKKHFKSNTHCLLTTLEDQLLSPACY